MVKTPTRAQNPPYRGLEASPLPKLITDPTPSRPPERVSVSRPLSSRGKCLFLLPESHRIEDLWHFGSLRPAGVCLEAPPAFWGCKKPSFFPPSASFLSLPSPPGVLHNHKTTAKQRAGVVLRCPGESPRQQQGGGTAKAHHSPSER